MSKKSRRKRAGKTKRRASGQSPPVRVAAGAGRRKATIWWQDRRLWLASGVVTVVLAVGAALWLAVGRGGKPAPATTPTAPRAGDLSPAARNGMYSAPPPMTIDPSKNYVAIIQTEKGDIRLQLFADKAPRTVNNFVFLARQGFYDDTTFHRVLPDFMAQGGDPSGTGAGGPGYQFADEFDPTLRHDGPGVISMANAGPGTNGSQFFITYKATPWLDDHHTVFGKVVDGMDVLRSLTPRDPQQNPGFAGDTIKTILIEEQ